MPGMIAQFNKLSANINRIMNARIEKVKDAFSEEGRAMLSEFRSIQYSAPHMPTPKRSKADDEDKKAKAIAYANQHSGNIKQSVRGKIWINRSFRAARGVHAYMNVKEGNSIAIGLYHTMSYGAYLEYGHGGRYKVLGPIVRDHAVPLINKIKNIMGVR